MKKWKYDLILGACCLAASLVVIVYSVQLKDPRATYFLARADAYLGLVIGLLALLSLLLMIRAWKSRETEAGRQTVEPIWDKLTVITAGSLLVYMAVIRYIGFIADSIVLMWMLSYLYSLKVIRNKKDIHDKAVQLKALGCSLAFSLAATFVTYFIFVKLLSTKLPQFSLF